MLVNFRSFETILAIVIFLQFALLVSFGTTSNRDIFFGLLFIYVILTWRNLRSLKQHYIFILLCIQYPLINIIVLALSNINGHLNVNDAAGFEMWFTSIACIVVATVFFSTGKNSETFVIYLVPVSVTLAFILAADQYFGSGMCRVALYNANVFAAPLFATALSIIHLIYFSGQQKNGNVTSYFLIFLSLILSSVFAGARSIYVASLVVLFFLSLSLFFQKRNTEVAKLTAVFVVALIVAIGIETHTGCDFFSRIGNVVGYVKNLITSMYTYGFSSSYLISVAVTFLFGLSIFLCTWLFGVRRVVPITIAILTGLFFVFCYFYAGESIKEVTVGESSMRLRLEMWRRALSLLEGNYAFGLGAHYEPMVSPGLHPHVHNMYLSWLIWGGVISLISGLVFLVAPIIALKTVHMPFQNVSLLIALPMIWMVSMLFDSFLFWKHHYYFFILISTLFYSLHSTHNTDREKNLNIN